MSESTRVEVFPISNGIIPPPRPFDEATCKQWLANECAPLFEFLVWALMYAESTRQRDVFWGIANEASHIMQAASDLLATGQPRRPVSLDDDSMGWEHGTRQLAYAVATSLSIRPGNDQNEPPYGVAALAELLQLRVDADELPVGDRHRAYAAMSYPMGAAEGE